MSLDIHFVFNFPQTLRSTEILPLWNFLTKIFIHFSFNEIVVEKQKFEINIYKKSSVTDNKVSHSSQPLWILKTSVEMIGLDIYITYIMLKNLPLQEMFGC